MIATGRIGVLVACAAAGAACAADVTVNSFSRGWYDQNNNFQHWNDQYIVGGMNGTSYRDFFAFNIPNAPAGQEAVAVTLRTWTAGVTAAQTGTIHDVDASISDLVHGIAAFGDLGTGSAFASLAFNGTESGTFVEFNLNAAGIAAVNAELGRWLALSRRSTGENDSNTYAYGGNDSFNFPNDGLTQLDITWGPSSVIPLPTSAAMAGVGLLALGARRRRDG